MRWVRTVNGVEVPEPPPTAHVIGLDLGQARDFSALAVDEVTAVDGVLHHAIRYLCRWPLGTPYPNIVADVAGLVIRPPLSCPVLAVDETGVGRPVLDMFRDAELACEIVPILITGGHSVTYDHGYHVPKKELVGILQATLGTGHLKIAAELPEAETLRKELLSFKCKVTVAGNESFEAWRKRDHDDMVLAVAMAVWLAERRGIPAGSEPFVVGAHRRPDPVQVIAQMPNVVG